MVIVQDCRLQIKSSMVGLVQFYFPKDENLLLIIIFVKEKHDSYILVEHKLVDEVTPKDVNLTEHSNLVHLQKHQPVYHFIHIHLGSLNY